VRRGLAAGYWAIIAALCAIWIGSAVHRGAGVASPDPSAFDREQVEILASLAGLAPDSPAYARLAREIPESSRNLNESPRWTFLHIAPGALLLLLAPFQFSRRLRLRHPAVHRWSGRFLLSLVAASGVAGLYLGLARPYGGAWESAATTLFGGFFIFAAARGYRAIRRRDVARHREWMIRMFATALAISVIRVLGTGWAMIVGAEGVDPGAFALSLWLGWIITLAVAEAWIRHTRASRSVASLHDLQPQ
jgi:uncharacterized membrane protein